MSSPKKRLLTKSFKCPESLAKDLEWLSKVLGVTQSDVIRLGITLLVRALDNNGHSRVKIRYIKLEPPRREEIEKTLDIIRYHPRKPSCNEIMILRYMRNKSWAEIAEYYGYESKYTIRSWFRDHCEEEYAWWD